MHSYVLYQVPQCFTSGSPSPVHLFYREDNLYLFHPFQFPSAELHHNAMQAGSPAKLPHLLPFGITVDLLHGCIPLFRRLCLEPVFREIFQFQNVAVLHFRISLQVRHEEHVAETVVQLHFGHGQVIGIDTQVGGEETLNVPFALYATAYR